MRLALALSTALLPAAISAQELRSPPGLQLGGPIDTNTVLGRSLQDRARDVVSVMDAPYNAKGDGVTDDTAAINAALAGNPGKIVVLPPRTFRVSGLVYVPAYTGLVGSGIGRTVIRPIGIQTYPIVSVGRQSDLTTADGAFVSDLTVDGAMLARGARLTNCVLVVAGTVGASVQRVEATRCGDNGIETSGSNTDISFNYVHHNWTNGIYAIGFYNTGTSKIVTASRNSIHHNRVEYNSVVTPVVLTVNAGGSGHAVGNILTFEQGVQARVTTVSGGAVTALTLTAAPPITIPAVPTPQLATTGSGTGVTVTIATNPSLLTAAAVASGGIGYAVGQTVTLPQSVVLTVASVSGGAITGVTISSLPPFGVDPSTLQGAVAQVSSSGSGTGATFTLTMTPRLFWDGIDVDPMSEHHLVESNRVVANDIILYEDGVRASVSRGHRIVNNYVVNSPQNGINFSGYVIESEASGNHIVAPIGHGVFLNTPGYRNRIAGNFFLAPTGACVKLLNTGISGTPYTGSPSNNDIVDNRCINPSSSLNADAGISLLTGFNNAVSRNRIRDDRGTVLMKFAVDAVSGGAGTVITDNIVNAGATGAIGFGSGQRVERNVGFNPTGAQTAPGIPASGTALANPFPYGVSVYVTGGTVSAIAVNGTATGLTNGQVTVGPGQTITLTYSSAPAWSWFGVQ